MISAFGPVAEEYASRLGDLDAVITDVERIPAAYAEALQRRERGETFYGLVCVEDSRVRFGQRLVDEILSNMADYDFRRLVLDQFTAGVSPVNGVPAAQAWQRPADVEAIINEFLALCDAVLVRSYAEASRILRSFAASYPPRPAPPTYRVLASSTVPVVRRERPDRMGVVVWAPRRPSAECALALHGLVELRGDLTCVTAGGEMLSQTRVTCVRPDDPSVERALSRAAVIVCIDAADPSDAVAFARAGYGVVAPVTSGAHEFAGEIVAWDAIDARQLYTAMAAASARPASVRNEPLPPPRAPARPPRPAFVPADALPLVSIVTPTYNRPEELREMLACVAAQTYPNIEAVVVNDGGTPVADVVAEFPFARLLEQPTNQGALRAVDRGIAEARGTYIGLLPDDDRIYPDHVERIMFAMLRSGAVIGHGSGFLRFLERNADDTGWDTVGFNNRTFSQTCTPTEALIAATIGGHQFIAHRSAYETAGGYLLDSDISDNEIHIRFTQRYFYAWADHVTSEFRDHAGGQGRKCDFPAALRHMYTHQHPLPDRPEIERQRLATIENIAGREPGKAPFPMTIRLRSI
jgi:hypothetical protein